MIYIIVISITHSNYNDCNTIHTDTTLIISNSCDTVDFRNVIVFSFAETLAH